MCSRHVKLTHYVLSITEHIVKKKVKKKNKILNKTLVFDKIIIEALFF